ncbi:hypothetical protein M7I_2975 [Glarea lozoyensis 74030]|uniref:SET domain-containing protein n=1 Tax=Glarea lozoyensis (strain ATCC 74030 / MF5533) TaxID=1104152 RepID=H0EK83_GLAL7|nr:hypothetical protein M7I_2975 [Glarea lozoyensis 74030]
MDVEGMKWDGGLLRPGNSAVRCVAIRDIKAGEELKISYVGDPLGMGEGRAKAEKRKETRIALEKWFPGGCGCEICKMEDEDARGKGGRYS